MSLYNAFRNEKKRKAIITLPKRSARFLHIQVYSKSNSDPSLWANICFLLKFHQQIQIITSSFFFIHLKGHLIWFFILGAEQLKKHNKNKECKRSVKIRESKRAPLFFYFPLPCFIFYVFHVWMPEFRAWQVIVYFLSVIVYWLFLFYSLTARMCPMSSKVCLLSLKWSSDK